MKIKVKYINNQLKFNAIGKGEWIDLRSNARFELDAPKSKYQKVTYSTTLIPLGVAMQLPKYFEANILPRSSTFKNWKITLANSMGIIDHTYCGNNDEWLFSAIAFDKSIINAGDRIAQFRIRPSQFAPWWVKLKWLFTNKIEFIEVDNLEGEDRGGFGSTGTN